MLHEMGIRTGVDLPRLIEAAELAEAIVGHPLPGSIKVGGPLDSCEHSLIEFFRGCGPRLARSHMPALRNGR